MHITELTDTQLARLLLRQIWQIYDRAGISHGRCLESKLLEAATSLIPLGGIPKPLDKFSARKLICESERRSSEKTKRMMEIGLPMSVSDDQ